MSWLSRLNTHLHFIPSKERQFCSLSLHFYALLILNIVSATDSTPTDCPQSAHWPSDAYWTQNWNVLSQSGKLLSDWLALCSSGHTSNFFTQSTCKHSHVYKVIRFGRRFIQNRLCQSSFIVINRKIKICMLQSSSNNFKFSCKTALQNTRVILVALKYYCSFINILNYFLYIFLLSL